jgi:uncharacterized protein (DUF1786 family)
VGLRGSLEAGYFAESEAGEAFGSSRMRAAIGSISAEECRAVVLARTIAVVAGCTD